MALEISPGHRRWTSEFDDCEASVAVDDRDKGAKPAIITLVPVGFGSAFQFSQMQKPGFSAVVAARMLYASWMTEGRRWIFGVFPRSTAQRDDSHFCLAPPCKPSNDVTGKKREERLMLRLSLGRANAPPISYSFEIMAADQANPST